MSWGEHWKTGGSEQILPASRPCPSGSGPMPSERAIFPRELHKSNLSAKKASCPCFVCTLEFLYQAQRIERFFIHQFLSLPE